MTGDAKEPKVLQGRYEITDTLGSGGFGTTYVARDQARFGAKCVVKELLPQRQESAVARRLFEREARVLCDLSHPQIPTMHGYFENGDRFFLVQDFVEGETLQARLARETRLSEVATREIVLQLLDVLEYLHQRTPPVIHRDIKPANIILARDGRVVLIDFGAVREAIGDDKNTSIGTMGYTPTEQMLGRATTASDCYALGATALEMISGLAPVEWHDRETGNLDWQGHITCTPQFEAFLAAMLAPLQQRIANATDAREVLLGGETRLGPSSNRAPSMGTPSTGAPSVQSSGSVPAIGIGGGGGAGATPTAPLAAINTPSAGSVPIAGPSGAPARGGERVVAAAPASRRALFAVPVLAIVVAAAVWAMRGDGAADSGTAAPVAGGGALVPDSTCSDPRTIARRTESEFDLHLLCPRDWTTRYVPSIRTTRVAAPHDSTQVWAALWRPAASGESLAAFAQRWRATMSPVLGGSLTLEEEARPDASVAQYRVTRGAQGVMLTGSLQVERTSVGGNAYMVWSLLLGATEASRPMALQVLGSIEYLDPATTQ